MRWNDAERILIALAPQLLAQGRWQTLSQWIEMLPQDRLDAKPWVRYWHGRSLAAVRPREARSILASAFESFSKHGHKDGQLLAATGVLEALFFEYDGFSIMDSWLEHVSELMDAQVRARNPEEELWVQSTLMLAAIIRTPGHRRIRNAVAQVMKLLAQPFDRMSALCLGTYANLNGRQQDFGVCEMTDQDGDKWWMEYHGSAAGGGGTNTSAHGTGKYEGMTLKGQYIDDNWPSAAKDTFQGCNPNKGTYKLK